MTLSMKLSPDGLNLLSGTCVVFLLPIFQLRILSTLNNFQSGICDNVFPAGCNAVIYFNVPFLVFLVPKQTGTIPVLQPGEFSLSPL